MKRYCFLFACLLSLAIHAQEKLVITGEAPNQYVVYTVTAETSLQSVSNQFGQSVTKLSTYNDLNPAKKLVKGTKIRIPLTQYNLTRSKGDQNSAPLYHKIEKGDNLYRISKEIKVPLATLRQWNGLKSEAVKIGDLVIVGYMVNARVAPPADAETAAVKEESKQPVNELPKGATESIAKSEKKTDARKDVPPAGNTMQEPVAAVSKPPVNTGVSMARPAGANPDYTPKDGDEGFFATAYGQQSNDQSKQFHSGDAATFKTISGWSDRKYYVLINDVAPETIVRITTPNNKSICAKVLGPLQETKGGTGLLLRMSNSAASTLGITDARFTVTVTYFE